MDLSAVVITYQSRDHVLECLRSLEAARGGLAMETVVVDNASSDGTADLVRREAPANVRVIESGGNLGYAKAVNIGTRATSGEFLLVLNPDCVLGVGSIATLIAWLRAHPRTAIAGPRLTGEDGKPELSGRSFPGPASLLFNRYSLLTLLFPRNPLSRRYLLSDWDRSTSRSVDWLSGSCMCVRRAAIDQVGGMDEAYFMFNEDVDWCRSFKTAGWAVDYVAEATVMHHIGASRRRVAERVIIERHRGMIHYFAKHHSNNPVLLAAVSVAVTLRGWVMVLLNRWRP